jgi:hypothetical protein
MSSFGNNIFLMFILEKFKRMDDRIGSVRQSIVDIFMLGQMLEIVKSFKYLGFTRTSKLPLKSTVNRCIEKNQRSLYKLKWLRSGRTLSKDTLKRCFFAYTFT